MTQSATAAVPAVEFPLYQIDAFTDRVFWGNPAAVCPLDAWLPEPVMQAIAWENNLPETAFLVPAEDGFELRWFTPTQEVDLCGHATLAAAHAVLNRLRPGTREVTFHSASGPLVVRREGSGLQMTFPALDVEPADPPEALLRGLGGVEPAAVLRSMDWIVVLDDVEQLLAVEPDLPLLARLDLRGVVVTAPAREADFASRFFGPKLAIPEDPITGSAHCALVPYWAARLGKDTLRAHQFSPRLGQVRTIEVECVARGDQVLLNGSTRAYLEGTVRLSAQDLDQPTTRKPM
ncbi:PhzF family phenazine biosynthesis protein [Catenulispora subtropica]|uniref:PhzF family phenazine biosynthesis protein n=1 Tax=Catenulispora subtropica TaxID=450798 RepID=A0ABP5DML9_9ACTN